MHHGIVPRPPKCILRCHVFQLFQQTAHGAAHSAGITALTVLRFEDQIPIADVILRKVVQKVNGCFLCNIQKVRLCHIPGIQCKAIHRPCLTPGPAAGIAVALMGGAPQRLAGMHIHEISVVGGCIRSHQIPHSVAQVVFGGFGIPLHAGLLRSPEQQRQIQVAVDDHTSLLGRVIQRTPRLHDAGRAVVPLIEQVCRPQCRTARFGVAGQFPCCHAAQTVKKAQIVGIGLDLLLQAGTELWQQPLSDLPVFVIPGGFIRQPEHSDPEAFCPVHLFHGWIDSIHSHSCREGIGEPGHHSVQPIQHLPQGSVQPYIVQRSSGDRVPGVQRFFYNVVHQKKSSALSACVPSSLGSTMVNWRLSSMACAKLSAV